MKNTTNTENTDGLDVGYPDWLSYTLESKTKLEAEIKEEIEKIEKVAAAKEVMGDKLDHDIEVMQIKCLTQQRALLVLQHLEFLGRDFLRDNDQMNHAMKGAKNERE